MLHFRCSPVLKEFFHVSLKRPFVHLARAHAQQQQHAAAAARDERRIPVGGLSPRPPAWARALCTRTEGAVTDGAGQQQKDGPVQDSTNDK